MEAQLTYRLYRDEDLPGILRLWEEDSGWGSLTPETWRQWYVDTPHGPCTAVVGVDGDGVIAGQEIFTPSVLTVGGRDVRALRLSAPILARSVRSLSMRSREHPVVGLYDAGAEAAVAGGYSVVYALPEHAWLPFFRRMARLGEPRWEFADAEFDCVVLPLAAVRTDAPSGWSVRPVTEFGPEYDELWRAATEEFSVRCGVVRSRAWLRFKNGGHITLEVRRSNDGVLLGYAAIKRNTGLIADIVAQSPGELAPVLRATLGALAAEHRAGAGLPFSVLRAMETPVLRPALRELGFTSVDYKFAFVCNTLDPSLSREAIAPERWFINPGD